ncbi:hypothetical protein BGZ94_005194 [Podila epigama]|nr:hypothetical protein BGZ94_005194 [Podila epigama]
MSRFNGTFNKVVPYVCVIPSDILHLAQQVPITFKALPTLNNGPSLQIVSAIVKLKQYTSLTAGRETKYDSKDVMNIFMNDGWPVAVQGQPWKRTIVVPLPTAPKVSPTTNAGCYVKTHRLKLIMQARIGNGSAKELRIERSGHDLSMIKHTHFIRYFAKSPVLDFHSAPLNVGNSISIASIIINFNILTCPRPIVKLC